MPETLTHVTLKGKTVNLVGHDPQIGQPAPEAILVANDLSQAKLSSFTGKKLIIASVPSLDTPVCDTEMKRFNKEAMNLTEVMILTISTDLPFAQKRWCAATGSDRIKTLSDHREASFGQAYGVLIKDLRLLARALFVIDAQGILRYKQIVPEIAQEPNYQEVLEAVKKI